MAAPDTLFQAAIAAFNAGDRLGAEQQFLKLLRKQPSHVPALNLIAIVLMSQGRFDEAEKHIARAVVLNQNSDASYSNYGLILQRLNEPERALEQFDKALALKADVAESWNGRGAVLNDLRRFADAVDDFDRALALNPRYPDCLCNKGNALLALDRSGDALAAYDAALAIAPDFGAALLGRGHALWGLGRCDDAFAVYRDVFARKPDAERAAIMRGQGAAGGARGKDAFDERDCSLVSSRGLLKSCDVFPASPLSSTYNLYGVDWSALEAGTVVYVPGSAIPNFRCYALDQIKAPIILVSGDCDESIADDIFPNASMRENFIAHPKIAHWFSQNLVTQHPKCSPIPIGIDFHTLAQTTSHKWGSVLPPLEQERSIKSIAADAPEWAARSPLGYCNFQFRSSSRFKDDRNTALARMDAAAIYLEPAFVPRETSWEHMSRYAFVISPHGNGLDCHRTWEALALGCIPVMRHSPLDPLFEGLPVVFVDDWAEVTPAFMQRQFENPPRLTQPEKLTLDFWAGLIRDKRRDDLRAPAAAIRTTTAGLQ